MSEIFAKQLMQLSGVSPDKAVAILEKYSTPKRCREEFLSRQTLNFGFTFLCKVISFLRKDFCPENSFYGLS